MAKNDKYIEKLIERDTAKPVKQYVFMTIKHEPLDLCPVCGTALAIEGNFCPVCGQKCDRDNIEL